MSSFWVFCCCLFCVMGAFTAFGNVVLRGKNVTLSLEDIEANFAPRVEESGKCGMLHLAEPLDACSTLTNNTVPKMNALKSPFVLIIRGGCSFDVKVRGAQDAGFKAALIYDDDENGDLVAMSGKSAGVKINAVFVSKASGETLAKYAGATDMELWLLPNFENSPWSIMVISFISLLAMSAVLATCFFIRRHQIRREHFQVPHLRQFHGMSSHLVKAMPSLIFSALLEDNSTASTCAICLEEYIMGDKLRILPCSHKFHAICVDAWLTSWRTFCPVCKRDARTSACERPASESTPLLSPNPPSISSSSVLSSVISSSATLLEASSSQLPSVSCPQSSSTTLRHQQSFQSPHQSPHLSTNQSFVDLSNTSSQSQISDGTYLVSPHSVGYPSSPSLDFTYVYPYVPTPGNASSSLVGSSSLLTNSLHCGEPAASISTFDSAQSCPV